jgi:hypothetical protein
MSLCRLIIDIFPMETRDLLRHQIINSLTAQHTEKVADAAINLWEQMATQIIAIVGEGGFNSLYARSVFLTRSTFPWLAVGALPPQADQPFAGLKTSLEGHTPAQAGEANRLLLITFTDILASLIGEQLTTSILRLAWGSEGLLAWHPNDASDRAGDEKLLPAHPKEFKNE